jgi:hypothetical protein
MVILAVRTYRFIGYARAASLSKRCFTAQHLQGFAKCLTDSPANKHTN